jgi:hypothetical protein
MTVSDFSTHSYRCPQEVMEIVEPAYQTFFSKPGLRLSGVKGRSKYLFQTSLDKAAIDKLQETLKENLMVLGFTREAIKDVSGATTVDAAVGLQATIVLLILERKRHMANQYDIRRLVPALTRCTHGLIVMWSERSWEEFPWGEIRRSTSDVYGRLVKRLRYERNPNRVVEHLLQEEALKEILEEVEEDSAERRMKYEDLRKLVDACTACAEEDLGMILDGETGDAQLGDPVEISGGSEKLAALEDDREADASIEGDSLGHEREPRTVEPTEQHYAIAELLSGFVAETVSYIFVESRGKLDFATPKDKTLKKAVFRALQHLEKGEDQGNATYNTVYTIWLQEMAKNFPRVEVPTGASQLGVSPAGNILETWKMIAETVARNEPLDDNAEYYVEAARFHMANCCSVPSIHDHAVTTVYEGDYGFCGCVIWVNDPGTAPGCAANLLAAFNKLWLPEEPGEDADDGEAQVKRKWGSLLSEASSESSN